MLLPKHVPPEGNIALLAMDHLRLPVFVVDPEVHIRYCNAAGMAVLKEGDSLRQKAETLSFVQPSDTVRLNAAVAASCAHGERQTLMINDLRNPKPQLVAVIPLSEDEPGAGNGALIVVQRCDPSHEAFAQSLRQLFRLSPAETVIAGALIAGNDVEQIAEMRNAKVTTVRTQIAAMMLKTRTRRQGELVSVLSRVCTLP